LECEHLNVRLEFPDEKLWTSHSPLIMAHRDAVARHGLEASGHTSSGKYGASALNIGRRD